MSLELINGEGTGEALAHRGEGVTLEFNLQSALLEHFPLLDLVDGEIEKIEKDTKELTAQMHSFVEQFGKIPQTVGYLISALEDVSAFLKEITEGREVFLNPPPKVELSAEDVAITHDYVITLPTKLDDLRYMGEWFNKVFFPNTRPLIKTEGEMSVKGFGSEETGEVEGVRFYFMPKEGTTFEVMSTLAGNQISLVEFANTIDTHVAE